MLMSCVLILPQTSIVLMMIHPLARKRPVLKITRSQHHLQEEDAQSQHLHHDLNPHIRDNLAQDLLCQEGEGPLRDPEGVQNPVHGHQGDGAQNHQHEKGLNLGHVLGLQKGGGQRVPDTLASESLDQGNYR